MPRGMISTIPFLYSISLLSLLVLPEYGLLALKSHVFMEWCNDDEVELKN